jgi:hypothetical protein
MSYRIPIFLCAFPVAAFSSCGVVEAAEIYRCSDSRGAVTFSDRSCGAAQQRIRLEVMPIVGWERVDPSPRTAGAKVKAVARQAESGSDESRNRAQECAGNRRMIDRINSTMRAGYTPKAGERLRERLRELEEFRFRNCR